VAGREAPAAVRAAAARLGGGRAALALELVGYDAELGAAMRYVFGSAFVCQARGPPAAPARAPGGRLRLLSIQGRAWEGMVGGPGALMHVVVCGLGTHVLRSAFRIARPGRKRA
jgi:hypothetical protein